ncbi:hypothetical protein [Aurantimonas sp. VKM B-3413]|uniref:hypothetical protein n=1 Tax=Aurantimonas sp. VKM B-3413 TaxID=2779401 RepID=UPI001E2F6D99|nr:hypothetical protein [Aurantimonas sp. VKM B-3413]
MRDEVIPDPSNRRRWQRRRTRLRPIKLLTIQLVYLEDGMCVDISDGGMRISKQHDRAVPKSLVVFDCSDRTFRAGVVPWASGKLIGFRFTSGTIKASPAQLKALGERDVYDAVYVRK